MVFCVTSSTSHIVVEEFWRTLVSNITLVYWSLQAFVYAQPQHLSWVEIWWFFLNHILIHKTFDMKRRREDFLFTWLWVTLLSTVLMFAFSCLKESTWEIQKSNLSLTGLLSETRRTGQPSFWFSVKSLNKYEPTCWNLNNTCRFLSSGKL